MRKRLSKSWRTVVYVVALLIGSTGTLAWAMDWQQAEVSGKTIQMTGKIASVSKSAIDVAQSETEVSDGFTMSKEEAKKTKADMSEDKAVNLIIKGLKSCFKGVEIKKVSNVRLVTTEFSASAARSREYMKGKGKTLRAYEGNIICEDGRQFMFGINSITGELVELRMALDEKEKGCDDKDYLDKMTRQIEKNRTRYEKAAQDFLNRMNRVWGEERVKLVNCSLCLGCHCGADGDREWEKVVIALETHVNGIKYSFRLDPKTYEVIWYIILD